MNICSKSYDLAVCVVILLHSEIITIFLNSNCFLVDMYKELISAKGNRNSTISGSSGCKIKPYTKKASTRIR